MKNQVTKLYIGKIFTIRGSKWQIPWKSHATLPGYAKHKIDREKIKNGLHHYYKESSLKGKDGISYDDGAMNTKDIGERVLILDERSKTVKVFTVTGRPIWISKFYLGTEIREEIKNEPAGELSKVVTDLANLQGAVNQTNPKLSKQLYEIMRRTKIVSDMLREKNNQF